MLPTGEIVAFLENVGLLNPSITNSKNQVMSHWSLLLLIHVIHTSKTVPMKKCPKALGGPKADILDVASSPWSSLDCEVLWAESFTPSFQAAV